MTPSKSTLTVPQYFFLRWLMQRPRFVRGSKYGLARRLEERGYVEIRFLPGVGREATITAEGRRAYEQEPNC